MRTKLLKRIRTDAHRAFGIKGYYRTYYGGEVYIIGLRGYQGDKDTAAFSLEEAKRELAKLRKDFCLKRVEEMRAAKFSKL